jgi:hypothetical protein
VFHTNTRAGHPAALATIAKVRRTLLASSLLAVLAASSPADAAAKPRVTANPNPIPFGKKLTVEGRGWPVIEFCSRTVRLSLRSDQNAFRIGTDRVGPKGRFRFTWTPRRDEVGRGDWTLTVRMRCESGQDGSPNPIRATTPIRIGALHLVVGRGRTSDARWTLLTRRSPRGWLCVGLEARPVGERTGPSSEGCSPGLRGKPLDLGVSVFGDLGSYAYGRAARRVGRIEVSFGQAEPMEARILPGQPMLGFHGRFWIAPFAGECGIVSAQAFDGEGNPLGRARTDCPAAP